MDLQLEKLELIKLLVETDDKAVIDAVKNIFASQNKRFGPNYQQKNKKQLSLEFTKQIVVTK